MTELIFFLPPTMDSSPGRVAWNVWRNLYAARDTLDMDLLLLTEDPAAREGYPELAIDPSLTREHIDDGVFYFPVSPVVGAGTAYKRLRWLHRRGGRLVSDYHGDVREDLRNHRRNRDLGLFLYTLPSVIMAQRILDWHEWIVLHSRRLEELLERRYDIRARTVVVPNGIDREVLDCDLPQVDLEGGFSICYHGRLTHEKGLDLLIEAVTTLPDGVRDRVHIHIFGRGPMERTLRHLASRLGCASQVHFRGHHPVKDVLPALASADLLVYPSRFDNFPVSVLEALAVARAPVLFSDRVGIAASAGPSLGGNVFTLSLEGINGAVLRAFEGGMDVTKVVEDQRAFARRHTWEEVVRDYVAFFNSIP